MISINTKRLHLRNLAQNDADVIGDNFMDKLVDCLEKCLIYGHIRRFAD